MKQLRTPLSLYTATFFASLGLSPLTACGGSVGDGSGSSNQDGADAGTGGSTSMGGASSGGAGGGTTTAGGSAGTGGFVAAGGWGGDGGFDGTGGASTGGQPTFLPCQNPTTLRGPNGEPTGYEQCAGGSIHRVSREQCASALPRAEACTPPVPYDAGFPAGCVHDSDCTDHPYGICETSGNAPSCYCSYGCVTDNDCTAGQICLCGNPVGRCVTSSCGVDAECGGGLCLSYTADPGCGGTAFACQTTGDACVSDADCTQSMLCSLTNGTHQCAPISCAIGRPFLVEGEVRLAPVARRRDWSSKAAPRVTGLSAGALAALARRWTEIGLMEHASIAAFARFALELLSLGAPPSLVAETQAAMQDETVHARDAFALASAYAGRPVGPGPLELDGSLGSRTPLEIVRTTILEGCIGETVAAVEAAEALAHSTDPAVREVLARVTEDETRHAELAWRFVQWVLAEGPEELRGQAARELVRAVEAELVAVPSAVPDSGASEDAATLRAHGVLEPRTRREIRQRVLSEIVLPCAKALVASASAAAGGHAAVPMA